LENGLLLRSDLHDLLDDDLLAINPETLTVFIHPSLANTIYCELNGKVLKPRADGLRPSYENLKKRWDKIGWLN
jgi:hypothetical protein